MQSASELIWHFRQFWILNSLSEGYWNSVNNEGESLAKSVFLLELPFPVILHQIRHRIANDVAGL